MLENSSAARLAAEWFNAGGFTLTAKDSAKESNLMGRPSKKLKIVHNSDDALRPLPPPPPPLASQLENNPLESIRVLLLQSQRFEFFRLSFLFRFLI